jgi:uncharacterized membrane protein YfcA
MRIIDKRIGLWVWGNLRRLLKYKDNGKSQLIVGASLMAGSFVGKAIVQRMSIHICQYLLDALLFCSGLSLLWAGYS